MQLRGHGSSQVTTTNKQNKTQHNKAVQVAEALGQCGKCVDEQGDRQGKPLLVRLIHPG